MDVQPATSKIDRRRHDRMPMHLPIECHWPGRAAPVRSVTRNVSTGGLYFEFAWPDAAGCPAPGTVVHVRLSVPPGLGHSSYAGHICGSAEVVRCDDTYVAPTASPGFGLAVRFSEALRLRF